MRHWIMKKFLLGYVRNLLQKLPLKGKMTYLGVILGVISAVASYFPDRIKELLLQLAQMLAGMDVVAPAQTTFEGAIVLVIVGAIRKLLNYAHAKVGP